MYALNFAAYCCGRSRRHGQPVAVGSSFEVHGRTVTVRRPGRQWGRSTHPGGRGGPVVHTPARVFVATVDGVEMGRMAQWVCGARTTEYRLLNRPTEVRLCPGCVARLDRAQPLRRGERALAA